MDASVPGRTAMTSEPAINPYDAVAYPGHSFAQTHPSRLATIAHFHGMQPALPAAMRVLELGCGRGGNLIPMAAQYPQSRFLGIDLSGTSIRQANASAAELALANMQLQMGRPRRDVLHDMGVRTGVDDMKALAAILIQADKFGSSIAQALRVQSDSMRVKRRQMAEEKAQQTAVKMIFPLVLFIFPGIFVVLVGPAAIMMINGLLSI